MLFYAVLFCDVRRFSVLFCAILYYWNPRERNESPKRFQESSKSGQENPSRPERETKRAQESARGSTSEEFLIAPIFSRIFSPFLTAELKKRPKIAKGAARGPQRDLRGSKKSSVRAQEGAQKAQRETQESPRELQGSP